jgi:SAM-dependent methyltransferase
MDAYIDSREWLLPTEVIQHWFESGSGKFLVDCENAQLQRLFQTLFGYYLVQLGQPSQYVLTGSRLSHNIIVGSSALLPEKGTLRLMSQFDQLALASESVDAVVMPHTLDFVANPHQVLREVDRVMIPEGHLIVFGFNPISVMGVRRLFVFNKQRMPWAGQFIRLGRLQEWLAVLGFEVVMQQCFFYRPFFSSQWMMDRGQFLEKLVPYLPCLGNAYVLVAKKKVCPVTPIKPDWKRLPLWTTRGAAAESSA